MSEELVRNHKNYFGLAKSNLVETKNNTGIIIPEAFILITEVELLDWRLGWTYDVFWSTESFDKGSNPIKDFRRNFWLEGQDFIDLKTAKANLFATFDERFRGLVLPVPSENAVFESAYFKTIQYSLDINFVDGDDKPTRKIKGDKYNEMIAQNMDVIAFNQQGAAGLIPILHAISAQKDSEFFADSSLILPN